MNVSLILKSFLAMLIAFTVSCISCKQLIPILTKLKFGQNVRADGPKKHLVKEGTPTMGGISFLIAFLVGSVFFLRGNLNELIVIFVTLAFGVIGFLDDYIKIVKKRSLGLRAFQKIILQLIIFIIFIIYFINTKNYTEIYIPFTGDKFLNLGLFFIPFALFVILGTVNGTNLTDGIDGLASSVTIIVVSFFLVMTIFQGSNLAPLCGSLIGSLMGFVLFNSYPAKIFMGDTGSLAIGGFIASIAIILKSPLFILIVGIIYVVEALSSLLQIGYFKLTKGKRLFKMAPIHHHFELSGFSETRIVTLFCVITLIAFFASIVGFPVVTF